MQNKKTWRCAIDSRTYHMLSERYLFQTVTSEALPQWNVKRLAMQYTSVCVCNRRRMPRYWVAECVNVCYGPVWQRSAADAEAIRCAHRKVLATTPSANWSTFWKPSTAPECEVCFTVIRRAETIFQLCVNESLLTHVSHIYCMWMPFLLIFIIKKILLFYST